MKLTKEYDLLGNKIYKTNPETTGDAGEDYTKIKVKPKVVYESKPTERFSLNYFQVIL